MNDVALITGGTRGIGLGIAKSLVDEGYDLALCGRREKTAVQEVIDNLRDLGAQVQYLSADIGDSGSRKQIVQQVRSHYGRLQVLVNNAGVAPQERNDLLDATEESFDRVLGINLKGAYFLTQHVANWMVEQQEEGAFEGCVINITSISSTVASPDRGEYCISKAGLTMATKLWSVRLAEFDIPVYEVRPGIVYTDMTSGVEEKYNRLIDEGLMLQDRWGTPEDVGKAVAMLARGDLPYSTGQVVMVDGGMTVDRL